MEVLYTAAAEESYVDAAITAVLQVHCDEAPGGDILVFLTGQARATRSLLGCTFGGAAQAGGWVWARAGRDARYLQSPAPGRDGAGGMRPISQRAYLGVP